MNANFTFLAFYCDTVSVNQPILFGMRVEIPTFVLVVNSVAVHKVGLWRD